MFAIAFDLVVANTRKHHPKGVSQAYDDIGAVLGRYDFRNIQGSVYTTDNDHLGNLISAVMALKALPWFPPSVRDIRAFRIELWSDLTALVKS